MKVYERVSDEIWEAVALKCGHATFFHTPRWARIVEKSYPGRFVTAARAFEFGPDDWVLLPMMETYRGFQGFFQTLSSNVFGVYGGLISTHPVNSERAAQIIRHLQNMRTQRIEVFGNPYAPAWPVSTAWERKENFTQAIALDNFADEEAIRSNYTHLVRNHINRAVKAGYTSLITDTPEAANDYFQIYLRVTKGRGDTATGQQELDLFINLLKHGAGKTALWLAKNGEKTVGGIFVFYHNRHAVAWHASFLPEELNSGISKFLHHQAILHAKKNGFAYYDFNPSGGHEGTVKFKEMFGATRMNFEGYRWENKVYKIYERVRTLLPAGQNA